MQVIINFLTMYIYCVYIAMTCIDNVFKFTHKNGKKIDILLEFPFWCLLCIPCSISVYCTLLYLGHQAPISQKVVNRTISDLSYDHLPTKFATVSQNLSECFFYDFRITTCGCEVFFVWRYKNRSIYLGRAPVR